MLEDPEKPKELWTSCVWSEKYKGLLKKPPNPADNTKTKIVAEVVAITVEAIRGTALLRIEDPRTTPQYGTPLLLIKIIIFIKPRATICGRFFIIIVPIV
jgi:hypothetical protein